MKKNNTALSIEMVYETVRLLKRANCSSHVLLSETAKELGVNKTYLMSFIEQNEKLFITDTNTKSGLLILDVYLHPEDNPNTQEWLDKQINTYKNVVFVNKIIGYGGQSYGFKLIEDKEKSGHKNKHLWRNTQEKIKKLTELNIVGEKVIIIDSYGGWINNKIEHMFLNNNWEEQLKNIGWEFKFD